jgi:membrane-associated HD superfamily phosphohydrolase
MTSDMILRSSAAALYLKLLIDIWRYYNKRNEIDVPGLFYAVASVALGFILAVLVELAQGAIMTPQSLAYCFLSGIVSAAQAIGVTEIQKRV